MIKLVLTIIVVIIIAVSTLKLAIDDWKKGKTPVIYLFPIYISLIALLLIWM